MEITANAVQSVLVNNNVIFTDTVIPGNCSIMHREDSGLIKLRGLTTTRSRARFRVNFNANIGLIRKRLKDKNFIVSELKVGKRSLTKVGVMYVKDIAKKENVDKLKAFLNDLYQIINNWERGFHG